MPHSYYPLSGYALPALAAAIAFIALACVWLFLDQRRWHRRADALEEDVRRREAAHERLVRQVVDLRASVRPAPTPRPTWSDDRMATRVRGASETFPPWGPTF